MQFTTLDGGKILALMAAGGAFALAGLWLMFRPKPEGGAAKLELFGMKFESSSAGLLVFLIGAAFLATPLVVDERSAGTERPTPTPSPGKKAAEPASGRPAVILPSAAGAEEVEPNNFLTEANQIERGIFYAGQTRPDRNDREDWYVLPTPGLVNADVRFQVRTRAHGVPGTCSVTVLDDQEREISSWDFADVGASSYNDTFVHGSEFLLIKVRGSWITPPPPMCQYELKVH
jgi:hypothetical protein